jgi:hypothetical protein
VRSLSEPRIDVPDFVPVLASPAVQELPDLPNRIPPPVRRAPLPPMAARLADVRIGAPEAAAPLLGAGAEDLADVSSDRRDR